MCWKCCVSTGIMVLSAVKLVALLDALRFLVNPGTTISISSIGILCGKLMSKVYQMRIMHGGFNRTHHQGDVILLVAIAELECLCQAMSIQRSATSEVKCVLYIAKVFSTLDSIALEKTHA